MTTYQCDVCGKHVKKESGSIYPLYSLSSLDKDFKTDDYEEICLSCWNAVNVYISKLCDEYLQERKNKVEIWFTERKMQFSNGDQL